ncbi:MAG: energy transducer TonB [Betaproteobacteria bacterium]|nr:energy transducer TonB [Betaproteobacteria bacterium]
MLADPAFHFVSETPEWRRSGRFFLIAVALHAAVLFYPLKRAIGQLEIPEPSAILVKLIEKPAALRPVAAPPVPMPPSKPQPPPAPVPTKPTPSPRQIIAVAAEPVASPTTFSVPAPVATPPAPVAVAQTSPASVAVTAARFNVAYLNNPEPKYPPLSRRLGEEGKVLLKVRVSADGTPASVELEKSSGFDRLDEAAKQAVARWRFVPAKRGDEPIEASVIVPIVFRLDS